MKRHKRVEKKIAQGKIPAFKNRTIITSISGFNKIHEREEKDKHKVKKDKTKTKKKAKPKKLKKIKGSKIKIKSIKLKHSNEDSIALNITIGNSTDLSKRIKGIQEVKFQDKDKILVDIDYNFTKCGLNTGNIKIKKQKQNKPGSIVVNGIDASCLQGTKTVYMDKILSSNSICIHDAEIESIGEITANCNGKNEFIIECDNELHNSYKCTDLGDRYKIQGLKHSGAQETIPFQKGFAYTSYWFDDYLQAQSDTSLGWLNDTNTEWVSILVTWYQDTLASTNIYSDAQKTPTDAAVIDAVTTAHNLGMKVMLKPHVDVKTDEWRGYISFSNESDWQAWFSNYSSFITHYAGLAEANNVEILAVGTELKSTTNREADWRAVISNVNSTFSGLLTYSSNWNNYQNINWWDALDFIGISAYFPLTSSYDPTVAELIAAWDPYKSSLSTFSASQNKSIVFTEIGYQSRNGTNTQPNQAPTSTIDYQEQADCYEAAFQSLFDEPWFKGMYWWMWYWDPLQDTNGFDVYTKPAEDIVRTWYNTSLKTDYSVTQIGNEYRFNLSGHHFLTIINDQGTFNIRPHPGVDINGWGSSWYMQPFLPGAVLKYTIIQNITPLKDKIEVIASGFVSRGASSTYGTWNININFTYNQSEKQVKGMGNYNIALAGALSGTTGDLNLYKIASNYLDDVPLLNNTIGDTGDMYDAYVQGNFPGYSWIPPNQPAHFPGDQTDFISIDVSGQRNIVDTAAQGYAPIDPAYKPSLKVVLTSQQAGIPMIFGGFYDTGKSQDFWEDNVGITPLILQPTATLDYNFDVEFNSLALPGDGIDLDYDGYNYTDDCNDSNVTINPSAIEICNNLDDNCNSQIDEGFDNDGDTFTICNNDCNDTNASIYPGAPEICNNSIDDNCNSQIDEGCNAIIPDDNMSITEDTLFIPGTYYLPNGITIDADNIVIDGNGAVINGSGLFPPGIDDGIYAYNRTNITVKNVTVTGYTRGISLYLCSSCNVLNNEAYGNMVGIGISGNKNKISNNKAHSNRWIGITGPIENSTIEKNEVYDNNLFGIQLTPNKIVHGVGYGNRYNEVINNKVYSNGATNITPASNVMGAGIRLVYASYNYIANNTIYSNNYTGIQLDYAGTNHNTIIFNNLSNNMASAIYEHPDSHSNDIRDNIID